MKRKIKKIEQKTHINEIRNNLRTSAKCDIEFLSERHSVIVKLASGIDNSVLKKCRRFVYKHWDKYHPAKIGSLILQGVDDASYHVSALDDILTNGFSKVEKHIAYKEIFLKKYIKTYGEHRFPNVLLAWEYLKSKDYKNAINQALSACDLDERCMLSWHILKEAYIQLRNLGNLQELLTDEEIERLEPLGYDLRGKICPLAFDRIFVQSTGQVMCCCPPLVPVSIGNVFKDYSWREIINSKVAKEIRGSIIDGSYKYCNRLSCQEIRNVNSANTFLFDRDKYEKKLYGNKHLNKVKNLAIEKFNKTYKQNKVKTIGILNLGFDKTCNLHCPQCRTGYLKSSEEEKKELEHLTKYIIPDMVLSSRQIVLSNTGEVFASKYYRKVLESIQPETHNHLKSISIFTNGLLLTRRMWKKLSNIHPFNIGIAVSVDAFSEKTYHKVRPPGNWKTLVKNLEFIAKLKKQGKIRYFEVEYVVQKCNYKEMKKFADWALNKLDVTRVVFHRLVNVGTYEDKEYKRRAIFDAKHPEFNLFVEYLKDPIFLNNRIHFTDLGYLLPK